MLPGIDGYQVCREIRAKSSPPIIMLSAKGEVFDKVLGLELGADDYIMKPFDSKEMVARVRAVLRRYQPVKTETQGQEKAKCVEYDGITINLTNYSVICDGKNVDMPPKAVSYTHLDVYKRQILPRAITVWPCLTRFEFPRTDTFTAFHVASVISVRGTLNIASPVCASCFFSAASCTCLLYTSRCV